MMPLGLTNSMRCLCEHVLEGETERGGVTAHILGSFRCSLHPKKYVESIKSIVVLSESFVGFVGDCRTSNKRNDRTHT